MRESMKARNRVHSDTFIKILAFCPIVNVFFFDFFKKTEKNRDRGDIPFVYCCKNVQNEVTAFIILLKVSC